MTIETVPQQHAQEAAGDEMPLLGIDHVELYVGNAAQATYWFTHALGFRETAYAGLETGIRDRSSHVLEQGRVRFVLTAPLLGTSEIARHVGAHGDGVKVIALSVPDAEHAYRYAVQHGARGVREPWEESDGGGTVRMATVAAYGDTLHTLHRAQRLQRRLPPRIRRPRRAARPPTRACSRASTTWSATSSSAGSTSGSATTSASSG